MKYVLVDFMNKQGTSDVYTEEFESAEEAIVAASYHWDHLTKDEKKHRGDFYVLESVNPDEGAEDHFDGNEIRRWVYTG